MFEKVRFNMISVHTKTQDRRFQIPTVWRAFSKRSFFLWITLDRGLVVEIKLWAFLNSFGVEWTESGANQDVRASLYEPI